MIYFTLLCSSPKISVIEFRRRAISLVRLFGRGEIAEMKIAAADRDCRPPITASLEPRYALKAAGVVARPLVIAGVLAVRRFSKICDAVIIANAIDVVDFIAGPRTRHKKPSDPMCVVAPSGDADYAIATAVQRTRASAGKVRVPSAESVQRREVLAGPGAPANIASRWIIVNRLAQVIDRERLHLALEWYIRLFVHDASSSWTLAG